MTMENKFDSKGRKIALIGSVCELPINSNKTNNSRKLTNELITFDNIPDDVLKKNKWSALTPEVVYEDVARWWFTLKP